MGLRNTLKSVAREAVAAFGDVGTTADYQAFTSATYDASAGTHTAAYSTVAGVTVIVEDFALDQVDGVSVRREDRKMLLPAASVSGVTPGINDRVIVDGATWQVQAVHSDPAQALWELQVRRS